VIACNIVRNVFVAIGGPSREAADIPGVLRPGQTLSRPERAAVAKFVESVLTLIFIRASFLKTLDRMFP
jgi:hypothetical protein